jgi:hypothetical protein
MNVKVHYILYVVSKFTVHASCFILKHELLAICVCICVYVLINNNDDF